jgi:Probable lipoprotein LpqN
VNRTVATKGAAIVILASGIGLVGCASTSGGTNASSKTSATTTIGKTTTSNSAKPQAKVAPRIIAPGPNPTIASYAEQNGITATPVHRGDPGAPSIDLPIPDGWVDAGSDTPAIDYWAIIDKGPEAAKYTPSIVATVTKLTGNVDQQKVLDLAPGELKNLPGFKPMGDGSATTLAGFPAYQLGGTWVLDGQTKAVAQKTVVIPASGALYVLRLNADCLDNQIDTAMPATIDIDEQAKITAS